MTSKLNQVSIGFCGAAASLLVILALWGTTPAGLRPVGVTLWFLLLLLALSADIAVLLDVVKRLFGPKKPQGRSFKPSLRQGLLLGIWLTIIVGLSSLRQLSLRDTILTLLLFAIIEFYLRLTT